jgi:hypothetical protein
MTRLGEQRVGKTTVTNSRKNVNPETEPLSQSMNDLRPQFLISRLCKSFCVMARLGPVSWRFTANLEVIHLIAQRSWERHEELRGRTDEKMATFAGLPHLPMPNGSRIAQFAVFGAPRDEIIKRLLSMSAPESASRAWNLRSFQRVMARGGREKGPR